MTGRECPTCKSSTLKVIYLGLPVRLCEDAGCSTLFGFWSGVVSLIPVPSQDGLGEPAWAFMVYEGGYWPALWGWLRGDLDVD